MTFEEYLRQLLLYAKEIESRKAGGEKKRMSRSDLKLYREKYFKQISQLPGERTYFARFVNSMVSLDSMLLHAEASRRDFLQQIFPADLAQVNLELQRSPVSSSRLPYLKSVMLAYRPASPSREHMLPKEAEILEGVSSFRVAVLGVLQERYFEVSP